MIIINDIQSSLLDIIKEFHDFCRKNDIKYYIIGGTFLGAIRHEGFIPWDDDIDIAMPRDDYNKLIEIKSKLPDRLTLLQKGYEKETGSFAYSKISDNSTTLIENINEKRIMGLYIDAFPIDGAGQSTITSRFRFELSRFIVYLLWINGTENLENYNFLKKIIIKCSKIFDNRYLYDFVNKFLSKREYKKYKFSGNFTGAHGFKEIIDTSFYGTPTLYKFEDIYLFGPEKSNDFLTQIYGEDYYRMPPIERQFSHHDYEMIDLDNSFFNYDEL